MDIKTTTVKLKDGFLGQSVLTVAPLKQQQLALHSFSKMLYTTAIGYYPLASYHDRERINGSGDYILIYCIDGHGYVEENELKTFLNPNSFYILSKHQNHHYGSLSKKPWSIYWIHFKGSKAHLLYKKYKENIQLSTISFDHTRVEKFNFILNCLNEDLDDTKMDLLYFNLLNFITSFTHFAPNKEEFLNDPISKTIRYMKERINTNHQIKEFASFANYSVTRFSQLFKAKTGYAPMQYFLHLKIQSACQYLCFSKMNVQEIAREIGFNDPFYFSRIFKSITEQSPLQYRKQYISG